MNSFLKLTTMLYVIFYLITSIIASIFIAHPIEATPSEKKYKILSIQHQDFLPYTHAYKGFTERLENSEHRENIDIEFYNAKSNLGDLDNKIKELSTRKDIDLIFTIGTQSTKKVSDKIKDIPIIFTGVGSPIDAGIIKDWKSSGKNITGIGTPNQITKGIWQAYSLAKFGSLGVTYLSGSPNHEAAVKEIKEFCKKNGVKFIHDSTPFKQKDGTAFPDDVVKDQLQKSLDYVLPKVDVFYVQASATYEKNFTIFRRAFQKYKVPSIGELIFIRKGIVMGVGPNDFIFGQQAADYAIKILFEGVKPSELPIDIGTKFAILMNLEAAKMVELPTGLVMPVLNSADAIYQRIDEW
ncbi:MAG: hypothetical protein HQK71_02945 [Desulfamplus sp.]|nr:hypothetical protein [Desulfamplus sp.]